MDKMNENSIKMFTPEQLKTMILGTDLILTDLKEAKYKFQNVTSILETKTSQLLKYEKDIVRLEHSLKELEELRTKWQGTVALNSQLQELTEIKSQQLVKAKQLLALQQKRDISGKQAALVASSTRMLKICVHLAETLKENNLLSPNYQSQLQDWKKQLQDVGTCNKPSEDTGNYKPDKHHEDEQDKIVRSYNTSTSSIEIDYENTQEVNNPVAITKNSTKNIISPDEDKELAMLTETIRREILATEKDPHTYLPSCSTQKSPDVPKDNKEIHSYIPATSSVKSYRSHHINRQRKKNPLKSKSGSVHQCKDKTPPQLPMSNMNSFYKNQSSFTMNPMINMNPNLHNLYPRIPFMYFNPHQQGPYQLQSMPQPYPFHNVPYFQAYYNGIQNSVNQQRDNQSTTNIVNSSYVTNSKKDDASEESNSEYEAENTASEEDKENSSVTSFNNKEENNGEMEIEENNGEMEIEEITDENEMSTSEQKSSTIVDDEQTEPQVFENQDQFKEQNATVIALANQNTHVIINENKIYTSDQSSSFDDLLNSCTGGNVEIIETSSNTSNDNKQEIIDKSCKEFNPAIHKEVLCENLSKLDEEKKEKNVSSNEDNNCSSVAIDKINDGNTSEVVINISSNIKNVEDTENKVDVTFNAQELIIKSSDVQNKARKNDNLIFKPKRSSIGDLQPVRDFNKKSMLPLRYRKFTPNLKSSLSKTKPCSGINVTETSALNNTKVSNDDNSNKLLENINETTSENNIVKTLSSNESIAKEKISKTISSPAKVGGEYEDDDAQTKHSSERSSLVFNLTDSSSDVHSKSNNSCVSLEVSSIDGNVDPVYDIKSDAPKILDNTYKNLTITLSDELEPKSKKLDDLQDVKLQTDSKIKNLIKMKVTHQQDKVRTDTSNHTSKVEGFNKDKISKDSDFLKASSRIGSASCLPKFSATTANLKSATKEANQVPMEVSLLSDSEQETEEITITTPIKRKINQISQEEVKSTICSNNITKVQHKTNCTQTSSKLLIAPAKFIFKNPPKINCHEIKSTSKSVQHKTKIPRTQNTKPSNTPGTSGVEKTHLKPISNIKMSTNGSKSQLAQPSSVKKIPIETQQTTLTRQPEAQLPGEVPILNQPEKQNSETEKVVNEKHVNKPADQINVTKSNKTISKKLSKLEKVRNKFTKCHPILQGSIALKKSNAFSKLSEKNETVENKTVETEMTPSRKRQASNSLSPEESLISPSKFSVPPLLSPITEPNSGELQMIKFSNSDVSTNHFQPTTPKKAKLIDAKPMLKKLSKIPIEVSNVKPADTQNKLSNQTTINNVNLDEEKNDTIKQASKLRLPIDIKTISEVHKSNMQAVASTLEGEVNKTVQQESNQAIIQESVAKTLVTMKFQVADATTAPKDRLVSKVVKNIATGPLQYLTKEPFTNAVLDSMTCEIQGILPGNSISTVAEALLLVVVKNCENEVDHTIGIAPHSWYITVTQRRVLALIAKLETTELLAGIEETLIRIIPSCIVNINPESKSKYRSVKQLCAMARIMVHICKKKRQISPLRQCLFDALLNLRSKSSAIAYEMLSIWPDIVPVLKGSNYQNAKYSTIKELPILMQCIVYALLSFNPEEDKNGDNKMYELKTLLQSRYNYYSGMRSALDVIQHIIQRLTSGETQGVENGLLLISGREGIEWTKKYLIEGELQRLLNKHAESPQADIAAQMAARLIGVLTKRVPLPESAYVTQVMTTLAMMLNKSDVSENLQENIGMALLTLTHYSEVPGLLNCLKDWVPKKPLSEEFMTHLAMCAKKALKSMTALNPST